MVLPLLRIPLFRTMYYVRSEAGRIFITAELRLDQLQTSLATSVVDFSDNHVPYLTDLSITFTGLRVRAFVSTCAKKKIYSRLLK